MTPGLQRALAPALGDGQAEGRVMAQEVHVILTAPVLGGQQHRHAEKFVEGVGDQARILGIEEALVRSFQSPRRSGVERSLSERLNPSGKSVP